MPGILPTRRRARTFAAAAAVLTLPALAARPALGAATGRTKAPPRVQDVQARTSSATTMSFSMDADVRFTAKGKPVSGRMTLSGVQDRTKQAASLTMDMGGFMTAIMKQSGEELPREFRDPEMFRMKLIRIGPKNWMSFPMLNILSGGDSAKPWVYVDCGCSVDADRLSDGQGLSPTQGLEMLKGLGASETSLVGSEKLDGVAVTHYRGTVKLDAVLAKATPSRAEQLQRLFGKARSLPVDFWVDEQGRARRIDMTISATLQGMDVQMTTRSRLSKFGEPVVISAPPASQISDDPLLTEALEQSLDRQ